MAPKSGGSGEIETAEKEEVSTFGTLDAAMICSLGLIQPVKFPPVIFMMGRTYVSRAVPISVPNTSDVGFCFLMMTVKDEMSGCTAKGILFPLKYTSLCAETVKDICSN